MARVPAERGAERVNGFPRLLRSWRQKCRLSQLDLALMAGVSQRHLSFLECGRSNPSRAMILQLSETLNVPLRDRNAWLHVAGYAPLFRARSLDDPQMEQVMAAIRKMLSAHEPFPAIAIDRAWNVRLSNAPFDRLAAMLGDDLWQRIGGDTRNLMRLMFHPDGIRPHVANWSSVGPLIWQRARREAEALGSTDMLAVLDELGAQQEDAILWSAANAALLPVVPLVLVIGDVRLSMFTIIATFGTAQDVTTDELRIETDHGADRDDDPGMFRMLITFDEQSDGKTVLTLRQLHPSKTQREATIGFGAVAYGGQTLDKLAAHLGARKSAVQA